MSTWTATAARAATPIGTAIADLTWVITHREDAANAYLNRGVAFTSGGSTTMDQAIADMSDAIALEPDNALYRFNRGLAYIRADHPRWHADLEAAVELAPEYGPAYNGLCWGYALDGEPEQALPNCDRALDLGQEGAALDGHAIATALSGDLAGAATDLEGYLTWVRTLPEAYYERYRGPVVEGWIEELRGKQSRADEAAWPGLALAIRLHQLAHEEPVHLPPWAADPYAMGKLWIERLAPPLGQPRHGVGHGQRQHANLHLVGEVAQLRVDHHLVLLRRKRTRAVSSTPPTAVP
ncbi:MAG: hypothetical protein R2851_15265 [Caldilineaceae bacterium]